MKPNLMFALIVMTAIILAASFGLHIGDVAPLYELTPDVASGALYVCPAADSFFDSFAMGLAIGRRYINMFFFATAILLVASWAWALYQNLLEDKFKDGAFKNVWAFTKMWFWAGAIVLLLIHTPNYFRNVTVAGSDADWVLCEGNTPGAVPVRAGSVKG